MAEATEMLNNPEYNIEDVENNFNVEDETASVVDWNEDYDGVEMPHFAENEAWCAWGEMYETKPEYVITFRPRSNVIGPTRRTEQLQADLRPICFFDQTFPPIILSMIVRETNMNAEFQRFSSSVPGQRSWVQTNIAEMQKFLLVLQTMALVEMPTMKHYWSTDPIYSFSGVKAWLSLTRFEQILRYLHVCSTDVSDKADKLWKVRPFLKLLREAWQGSYTLSKSIVVDEQMVPFKGRLSFKQYI